MLMSSHVWILNCKAVDCWETIFHFSALLQQLGNLNRFFKQEERSNIVQYLYINSFNLHERWQDWSK